MLTSKQRASLRGMANTLDTILYIGKEGITDNTVKEAYDALEARELIKCAVQQGCELTAREALEELCARVHAEPVQCIGRRFVMYRESRQNSDRTVGRWREACALRVHASLHHLQREFISSDSAGGGKRFLIIRRKRCRRQAFSTCGAREGAGACWTGCWTRWARSGLPLRPMRRTFTCGWGSACSAAGLPAVHEALLAPGCRIDYLVGGVGVEIKKGRPDPAALRRQLDRYAACQGVEALVVLTERAVPLPARLHGKPVRGVALNRLWGVALP